MAKITQPNLPADLPEDWNNSQYVSADGLVAGLTTKHGYNYLMEQVNAAQTAVNTLAEQAQTDLTSVEKQVGTLEQSVGGLEKGGFNATAQRTGTTVTITGPEDAVTVTFLAPADWTEGDSYTYNGQTITLTDLNGKPVKNGWKQGAPVTLSISGSTAYFAAGPQASLQTVKITTSWAKKSTSAGTQYWEQPVTVPGLTAQAQVDIALDADGLSRLLTDGVSALWAENNMGNLTVKTLDAAPKAVLTLYLTITEVTA